MHTTVVSTYSSEDEHELWSHVLVVGFQVNKFAAKCRKWRKCGKRTKRLQSAQMAVIAEMAQSAQSWRKKEQAYYYYWEGALASKKDIYLLPVSNQGACKCAI